MECSPVKPGIDAFHRERSRFTDAFARCEIAVVSMLSSNGAKICADPLGQKIARALALEPSQTLGKARKAQLDPILRELLDLIAIRADVIHAPLRVIELEGNNVACFVNTRNHGEKWPAARLVTFDNFRALTRRVAELAIALSAP